MINKLQILLKKTIIIISMNKKCFYIILFIIVFTSLVIFYPKEVVKNTVETLVNSTNETISQTGGVLSNEIKNLMECNKILSQII